MVSGIVVTCVLVACWSVRVHLFFELVVRSSTWRSMLGGEGGLAEVSTAVLQNISFPSKLESKRSLAWN